MGKSSLQTGFTELFIGVIFLIIAVTLLTAFAPTVHTATDTSLNSTGGTGTGAGALVNVSANAQTIYGFTDLVWAGGVIAFIILGIFSLAVGAKTVTRG